MSTVPVSQSALLQFNSLVIEAQGLIREARSASGSDIGGKLAEVENKLNNIQALVCPMVVVA